jgi:hypothetical protein
MTKENYRNMMSEKLIVAFQQTFYEKVGYVPIVHTNREHRNNNKILKLEELESIIIFELKLLSLYYEKYSYLILRFIYCFLYSPISS